MRHVAVALVLGLAACSQSAEDLLPAEASGYLQAGEDGVFTADTLFDLIDGGAEVYRSLNVRQVVSRTYAKPDAGEIIVDVFDMGSPADAYGAFHHDIREGKGAGIGRESELEGNSLAFWKGRFFVSLVAFDELPATRAAMQALATAVAGAIQKEGEPPALVGLLPQEGLVTSHVSYFHDWGYLSTRVRLGREDPFGLGRQTEGLLARYRNHNGAVLLLVRFPSGARAAAALHGVERRPARAFGDTVAVVLGATTPEAAAHLLDAVALLARQE